MSELVVLAFDDRFEAQRVLTDLARLQKEYLIDLEDAVIVERRGDGKIKLRQSVDLVGPGALSGGTWGALWGTLIGLLFLNPLAGLLAGAGVGAGTGALAGALTDYGIDDTFIRELGSTITPDSSALFLLIRQAKPERVLEELSRYDGRILRTSLSREDEERLRTALEKHAREQAA